MHYTRKILRDWLIDALKQNGGKGKIVELCKIIWKNHEKDLLHSGELFYTWQYDVRWAATALRKDKIMKPIKKSSSGTWELY